MTKTPLFSRQIYAPGTRQFGFAAPLSVPLGATRIRMEFDVSAFLDSSMELTVTVERSFNGDGGPWELDFSYTRPGGAFLNDDGTPEVLHHFEVDIPQPTNNRRRVRGSVRISGGSLLTEGSITLS